MVVIRKRKDDHTNGDIDAYKNRTFLDLKTIALLISFIVGGGGVNYGIDKLGQEKIEDIRNDVDGLNIRMSSIEVSFDDYLKSHNKEVELIIQNLNYKIDHIAEELEQIKILEKKQLNEIQK